MTFPKIRNGKTKNSNSSIGGLSEEEIQKMVKDAEANKEADKRKESVDARNPADNGFSSRKKFKEHGDKISAEEKKAIENGITDPKKSLEDVLKILRKKLKFDSSFYEIR